MKKVFLVIAALIMAVGAKAQIESPVNWSYAAKRISATEAIVYIKASIQKDWHIYSQTVKDGGPSKTLFTFNTSKDYALVGKTAEPKPITKYEDVFKMNVGYFEKEVVFSQKIKLKSARASAVNGKVEFMVCNNVKCLPPDEVGFSIPLGK